MDGEGLFVNNQYPYNAQRTQPDSTTQADSLYPPPTQTYQNPAPYGTRGPGGGYNPYGDLPTVQSPMAPQPPYRTVLPPLRDNGAGAALASLLLSLVSLVVSVVPVCGIIALLPALMGLIFGAMGLKSRRRTMATLGILLSAFAIALALTIVA